MKIQAWEIFRAVNHIMEEHPSGISIFDVFPELEPPAQIEIEEEQIKADCETHGIRPPTKF